MALLPKPSEMLRTVIGLSANTSVLSLNQHVGSTCSTRENGPITARGQHCNVHLSVPVELPQAVLSPTGKRQTVCNKRQHQLFVPLPNMSISPEKFNLRNPAVKRIVQVRAPFLGIRSGCDPLVPHPSGKAFFCNCGVSEWNSWGVRR